MKKPALGLIEFKSIAHGIFTTDAMVKKAPVQILETHPICPGKYMTLIAGEVGDVEEAMKVGIEIAGDMLVNDLLLPQVHLDIIPSLTGTTQIETFGALGIIETFSVASCIVAADIAAKATPIKLVEMRLANGLGGKAYFVMTGLLSDVEESLKLAAAHVRKEGLLAASSLIASPHPDLISKGVYW